jgi:hypothetical protein
MGFASVSLEEPQNGSIYNGHFARNSRLLAFRNFCPMKPQNYEQRLQEIRKERSAETKQVERLSAILVKKASAAKVKNLFEKVARSVRSVPPSEKLIEP